MIDDLETFLPYKKKKNTKHKKTHSQSSFILDNFGDLQSFFKNLF